MADWQKIKTEYITGNASYRELAQKYGIHRATIGQKAKDEKWVELRRQHADKTQTKILNAVARQQVSRAERLQTVADKLLSKVESLLETDSELPIDTQGMKHLSGVLKDIKEIQMIKSQKDLEEQDARIAKLRREAEKEEDTNTEVVITFGSGGKKEWAE